MSAVTWIMQVGSDGNIVVPVGASRAGEYVRVDVSPAPAVRPAADMTPEQYRALIESTAGTWVGDFEEPEDLPPEKRDEL